MQFDPDKTNEPAKHKHGAGKSSDSIQSQTNKQINNSWAKEKSDFQRNKIISTNIK